MRRPWFALGALLAAAAVMAGAFGAHALRARIDAEALAVWETAARYLVFAGLGLLAIGLGAELRPHRAWDLAGTGLLAGSLLFCLSLGGLALGGPRWLGLVTPVGGVLLIVGFALAAVAGARR
jgi:uncharacterized membrane protein YgdD (TMEM256/DUF423 family)